MNVATFSQPASNSVISQPASNSVISQPGSSVISPPLIPLRVTPACTKLVKTQHRTTVPTSPLHHHPQHYRQPSEVTPTAADTTSAMLDTRSEGEVPPSLACDSTGADISSIYADTTLGGDDHTSR